MMFRNTKMADTKLEETVKSAILNNANMTNLAILITVALVSKPTRL